MPYISLMSLVMDEEIKNRYFPQFFLFHLTQYLFNLPGSYPGKRQDNVSA